MIISMLLAAAVAFTPQDIPLVGATATTSECPPYMVVLQPGETFFEPLHFNCAVQNTNGALPGPIGVVLFDYCDWPGSTGIILGDGAGTAAAGRISGLKDGDVVHLQDNSIATITSQGGGSITIEAGSTARVTNNGASPLVVSTSIGPVTVPSGATMDITGASESEAALLVGPASVATEFTSSPCLPFLTLVHSGDSFLGLPGVTDATVFNRWSGGSGSVLITVIDHCEPGVTGQTAVTVGNGPGAVANAAVGPLGPGDSIGVTEGSWANIYADGATIILADGSSARVNNEGTTPLTVTTSNGPVVVPPGATQSIDG